MVGILVNDALRTLWCEPIQDYQHVYTPNRITKPGGSKKYITVSYETVKLPKADELFNESLFHVYQIGKIPLETMNIELTINIWERLDNIAIRSKTVFDLFISNGYKIPLTHGYLQLLRNGNIILAVEIINLDLGLETYNEPGIGQVTRQVTLNNSVLRFRTYTNARYDSISFKADPNHTNQPIKYYSRYISTQSDYVELVTLANDVINNNVYGRGLFYLDGLLISKPIGWLVGYIGKTISFSWDESIKEIALFDISILNTFISNVDVSKEKYILIRDTIHEMIDFQDDIDVYITKFTTQTAYTGVFLGRINVRYLRQLNHTSYSLDKLAVDNIISANSFLTGDLKIMLVIREGGMKRGLTHQHVRMEELYKLNFNQVYEAITNITTIPEWYARNLESSAYTAIMSSSLSQITNELVEEAYGYNTAIKVGAEPFRSINVLSGHQFIEAPPVCMIKDKTTDITQRSIFLYKDGLLVNKLFNTSNDKDIYVGLVTTPFDFAEVFNYKLSNTLDGIIYDDNVTDTRLSQYGFRCYGCVLIAGVPDENWVDITDSPYYSFDPVTNTLEWNYSLLTQGFIYPAVKINDYIQLYEQTGFPNYNGVMEITLESNVTWLGVNQVRAQTIYPGTIDVFMDGAPLIENIDYYVDFPKIVVVRKPITEPDLTEIVIRTYGFCNPITMKNYPPRERGFVKEGILSINDHYDIRNDRSIRVVVNGLVKNRSEVKFAEESTGNLSVDGRPYAISDFILPVENFTTKKTIEYRNNSIDMDNRVMSYLTPRLPESEARHPVVYENRWLVFSPLTSLLLHLFQSPGFLDSGELDTAYTKTQVNVWLQSYLYLLEFDPAYIGVEQDYINIKPHQYDYLMSITNSQYRFIEFVINNYLNGAVDQSPNVAIW